MGHLLAMEPPNKKAPPGLSEGTETVQERLTGDEQIAPAEDFSYASRRHEGPSLWREGLAMVARQKRHRQPAIVVIATLTRWESLSLLISHAATTKCRSTPAATGHVRQHPCVAPYRDGRACCSSG
jgi:hypothetical protein